MGVKTFLAAAAMAASLTVGQASAAVFTINFNGNGGLQAGSSMMFSDITNTISVTATAGAYALTDEYAISSRIGQYGGGLGNTTTFKYDYQERVRERGQWVWKTRTKSVTDGTHEVDDWIESDGHGVREYIAIDFGSLGVTLLGAVFGEFQLDSHRTDGDDSIIQVLANGGQIYSGGSNNPTVFVDHVSNIFYFLAGGDNKNNNDWKLKSISFNYDEPEEPGPDPQEDVPAPAGMALLGLGLLGLGIRRRIKA